MSRRTSRQNRHNDPVRCINPEIEVLIYVPAKRGKGLKLERSHQKTRNEQRQEKHNNFNK